MLQHRSGNMYRDYGDVVYAVLKPRCFNPASDLRLSHIHQMLDTIANEDIKGLVAVENIIQLILEL